MTPEFIPASPALNKLISYYLILKSEEEGVKFTDRYIPDGQIGIVFLFRVKKAVVVTDEKKTLPSFFLVVPKIMPLSLDITLPADAIIVICKASVLSAVFNIRFTSLKAPDIEIDLFDSFPMLEKLRKYDKTEDKINYFEDYLCHHFPITDHVIDEIDMAYNLVIEKEGNITVNEIIQSLNINYRTLRRNFHSRVGIGLKGLIRVVRVKYLWKLLMENTNVDFQSLVVMGNFHDQPHLINDFKKIVGETPKAFFSRNLENVKALSGFKP